jgi:2-C-methyl-D-erythritol 4-phosphate cytidylyltransferase
VFLLVEGEPIVARSLRTFGMLDRVVLVTKPVDDDLVAQLPADLRFERVYGGATRQDSELAALRHLAPEIRSGDIDVVLIHDSARPLVSPELIATIVTVSRETGGAVPGLERTDLVHVDSMGRTIPLDPTHNLIAVQTPQGFHAQPLLEAYEKAAAAGFIGTDTASCIAEYTNLTITWVPGEERNFKVTYPEDLDRFPR